MASVVYPSTIFYAMTAWDRAALFVMTGRKGQTSSGYLGASGKMKGEIVYRKPCLTKKSLGIVTHRTSGPTMVREDFRRYWSENELAKVKSIARTNPDLWCGLWVGKRCTAPRPPTTVRSHAGCYGTRLKVCGGTVGKVVFLCGCYRDTGNGGSLSTSTP